MTNTQFGTVLSNKPFVTAESQALPTDVILRNNFQFYGALLKNYVKYSQEIENLPKQEVIDRTMSVANALVEEHKFGSLFISELRNFIASRYQKTGAGLMADIAADANIDQVDFNRMMAKFQESPLLNSFSGRFKMMIR